MVESVEVDQSAFDEEGAGVAFARFQFPDFPRSPFWPSAEKLGFLRGRVVPGAEEAGPFLYDRTGSKGFWGRMIG